MYLLHYILSISELGKNRKQRISRPATPSRALMVRLFEIKTYYVFFIHNIISFEENVFLRYDKVQPSCCCAHIVNIRQKLFTTRL